MADLIKIRSARSIFIGNLQNMWRPVNNQHLNTDLRSIHIFLNQDITGDTCRRAGGNSRSNRGHIGDIIHSPSTGAVRRLAHRGESYLCLKMRNLSFRDDLKRRVLNTVLCERFKHPHLIR